MCGVAGFAFARTSSLECPRESLMQMTRALTHRGPDQEGYLWQPEVGLGSRRLSIIDVSDSGRMPLFDETRQCAVIQNGEIYNFRELRSELQARGHVFTSHTDTEVIAHLYEELGTAAFERLQGMFAIAVWDAKTRTLVLARDRFGEKPLYYYRDARGGLLFASELKALAKSPLFERTIDWESLRQFLELGYILGPHTPYKQTFKLQPGHFLRFELDTGRLETERYWAAEAPLMRKSSDEPQERRSLDDLSRLFTESVRSRLVSDVPIGAFLSGGVDSTLVVNSMARLLGQQVNTFSIGYRDGAGNGENAAAQAMSKQLGTNHTALTFEFSDLERLLHVMPGLNDDPVADTAELGVYLIAETAKARGVTVMLSGDGGDELFFGYPLHRWAAQMWYAHQLPSWFRGLGVPSLAVMARASGDSRLAKAVNVARQKTLSEALYYLLGYGAWSHQEVEELWPAWPPPSRRKAGGFHSWFDRVDSADDAVAATTLALIHTYLPDNNLQRMDRASMANGVETRAPFLDPTLLTFAMQLPADLRTRGTVGKYLLRKALAETVGAEVANRAKQGFNVVPIDAWLRSELRPLVSKYLAPAALRRQGLFDADYVSTLLGQHQHGGRFNHSRRIWILLVLQMWLEHWGSL